jgi:DNA-binding transcriptional LysR family regulator
LNQLERSIGQQLVRRTTRRVEPTEIGLRLAEHGRAIHKTLLAARESVSRLGQTLQGRVRLSVPSGYGQTVMSAWLIAFKRLYPDIVLDVVFENRVADLVRDDIDIAVRVISEPPQNLVARDMGPVTYVVCASIEYAQAHGMPAELDELRAAPIITSGVVGRHLRAAAYRRGERHEVLLEPTVISENFMFLREAIIAGVGIGIVPDYVVHDDLRRGTVVTSLDTWRLSIFGTRMYMLYMPERHRTLAASTLIEFVLNAARESWQGKPEETASRETKRAPRKPASRKRASGSVTTPRSARQTG